MVGVEYGGYSKLPHYCECEYVCFVCGVQELQVGDGCEGCNPTYVFIEGDTFLHRYVVELVQSLPAHVNYAKLSLNDPLEK